jgi:hypothetical protein
VKDVDLALSDISDIRAQLVGSTRFVGISPGFNAILAFLTAVVTLFQTFLQPVSGQSATAFIAIWGSVLFASTLIITVDAFSRSRRCHGKMAGVLFKTVLQKIMPFLTAAVIVTWVICSFAPEAIRLLPGLWLMLLGLLGFAVLSNVPRELIWVAYWYFCCGTVVLAVAGYTGNLAPWMMGVPFTLGHLTVAFTFNRANGGIGVYKKI